MNYEKLTGNELAKSEETKFAAMNIRYTAYRGIEGVMGEAYRPNQMIQAGTDTVMIDAHMAGVTAMANLEIVGRSWLSGADKRLDYTGTNNWHIAER